MARLAGLSAVLVLVAVSAAAAAGPGGGAAALRSRASVLDSRAHRALLDLYALDTQLQNARTRLASLHAQAARLREQQVQLTQQVTATKGTLDTSLVQLGANLRTLYEQGDSNDTLAVVLGAKSLDEAVTALDDLTRVTDQSKQVVEIASAAQIRLTDLRSTLATQRAQLDTSIADARQTTDDLASARAERIAFIANLRSEQALTTRQISALQTVAHRVEVKSQKIQAAAVGTSATPATPSDTTPAPPPAPASSSAPPSGGRTVVVSSTGYSLPGHTASGLPVGWGVVAVDPSVIPLGTRMTIPGYGEGVAADRGSAVRGADIDLWFPTLGQALAWGRRTVTITLH